MLYSQFFKPIGSFKVKHALGFIIVICSDGLGIPALLQGWMEGEEDFGHQMAAILLA